MQNPERIVILGAGFAGTYAFKSLQKRFKTDPSRQLTLVNRENYFLFTPLLHEVATGGLFPENIVEPLPKIVKGSRADLRIADVKRVRLNDHVVELDSGDLPYDTLVMALGSTTNFFDIPGAERCFTLKTLKDALALKKHFIDTFEKAQRAETVKEKKHLLHFVVVGGGPTGVELAAEMSEFFYETLADYFSAGDLFKHVRISLIERGDELLPQFPVDMRQKVAQVLEKKHIDLHFGTAVAKVEVHCVTLSTGECLDADSVIWVAGVKPTDVQFDEDIERDKSGRIVVEPSLLMKGRADVFVLGDQASRQETASAKPLPATAQVAMQEAHAVAENIERKTQKPFHYRHRGDLVSLGQWMAVAQIANIHFMGRTAWWLWRTVYWSKLPSWQKKVQVALDWTIDLFSKARDVSDIT